MGRKPCCSEVGLKKGAWTVEEDRILKAYIRVHGEGKWRSLPTRAGLKRCGKSCRLRWLNYLRPDVKRGNISHEEEDLIIRLHKLLGNKWSLIARRLPGRTDNEIKNYWNTNLRKRMQNKTIIHQSKSSDHAVRSKIKMKPPMVENTLLVQTKAIQCTKMFVNLEEESINYADKLAVVEASVSKDFATETASQSKPEECSPLRGNYWDFLMDLDVNDAFASEATDAENSIENCERLIQNWISNPVQPDPDLELKAVAAFLNCEEESFGGEKYDLIGNSASDCVEQ